MTLYTRTGDEGQTSLPDGTRVGKDDVRVAVCGDVDELNSVLGWCRSAAGGTELASRIEQIQRDLFRLGPVPNAASQVSEPDCRQLEHWIDEADRGLEPLRHFVLPGESELAARLHVARACCRRAERTLVGLARSAPVRTEAMAYLNRLSDLLFVWARQANTQAGVADDTWAPKT